jgi:hypothetical protein
MAVESKGISLEPEMWAKIQALAVSEGRSLSNMVARLLFLALAARE